jgi:hypothetical protein
MNRMIGRLNFDEYFGHQFFCVDSGEVLQITYSATGTATSAPAVSSAIPVARLAFRLKRLFKSKLRPGTGTNCVKAASPISENFLFIFNVAVPDDLFHQGPPLNDPV